MHNNKKQVLRIVNMIERLGLILNSPQSAQISGMDDFAGAYKNIIW